MSSSDRIFEEYKKHETTRIMQSIHAATALAGGAIYKNELADNAFFYIVALLFSVSAYGFWYLCESAHARNALWRLDHQGVDSPNFKWLGTFGQISTFAVIALSFGFSILGLCFDFVLREGVYFERDILFAAIAVLAVLLTAILAWLFRAIMK